MNTNSLHFKFSLIIFSLLVTACAQQPLTPIENLQRYQSQLRKIDDWQLKGRIVVRFSEETDQARVAWKNSSSAYSIRLSGALGIGTTYINGDENGVSLEQGGKAIVMADNPETLLFNETGWDIPISEMNYWVRGIPSPRNKVTSPQLAPEGMLMSMEQSGWKLQYSKYKSVGRWNLPGKIIAERDEVRLTLVVNDWTLDDVN